MLLFLFFVVMGEGIEGNCRTPASKLTIFVKLAGGCSTKRRLIKLPMPLGTLWYESLTGVRLGVEKTRRKGPANATEILRRPVFDGS